MSLADPQEQPAPAAATGAEPSAAGSGAVEDTAPAAAEAAAQASGGQASGGCAPGGGQASRGCAPGAAAPSQLEQQRGKAQYDAAAGAVLEEPAARAAGAVLEEPAGRAAHAGAAGGEAAAAANMPGVSAGEGVAAAACAHGQVEDDRGEGRAKVGAKPVEAVVPSGAVAVSGAAEAHGGEGRGGGEAAGGGEVPRDKGKLEAPEALVGVAGAVETAAPTSEQAPAPATAAGASMLESEKQAGAADVASDTPAKSEETGDKAAEKKAGDKVAVPAEARASMVGQVTTEQAQEQEQGGSGSPPGATETGLKKQDEKEEPKMQGQDKPEPAEEIQEYIDDFDDDEEVAGAPAAKAAQGKQRETFLVAAQQQETRPVPQDGAPSLERSAAPPPQPDAAADAAPDSSPSKRRGSCRVPHVPHVLARGAVPSIAPSVPGSLRLLPKWARMRLLAALFAFVPACVARLAASLRYFGQGTARSILPLFLAAGTWRRSTK